MNALILVDLQNDLLPGGSIAVPNGEAVIRVANELLDFFELIVATQDWHPAHHCSFAATHAGAKPGDILEFKGATQLLRPVHCVHGTHGAELPTSLPRGRIERLFLKGTELDVDDHSGFYDQGRRRATGLGEFLKSRHVSNVYIAGLTLEQAVKFTALDALTLGFRALVIQDACRGLEARLGDGARAVTEMERAGVILITSDQVMGPDAE